MPRFSLSSLTGQARRRAIIALAVGIPLVVGAVALPKMFGGADDADVVPTAAPPSTPPPAPTPEASDPADPEPVVVDDGPEPSVDGDLVANLRVRFQSYPPTAPIRAVVALRNLSLDTFHVPAAGEPQPTLAVVVLDQEGTEVRRVVETGTDRLARNTVRLESGETTEIPLAIVAPGEEALPPGTYAAFCEYRADPAWKRLGLTMWRAPEGAIYSERVTFEVRATDE